MDWSWLRSSSTSINSESRLSSIMMLSISSTADAGVGDISGVGVTALVG